MRCFKVGRFEVFFGWVSPTQPDPPYVLRYWGVSYEAMFFGSVTAFAKKVVR